MLRDINDLVLLLLSSNTRRLPHLGHLLVVFDMDESVVHAVHEQGGHYDLSVIDFVPLGPILPAHHGAQHKGWHMEGPVIFQHPFLSVTLSSKAGPAKRCRFPQII